MYSSRNAGNGTDRRSWVLGVEKITETMFLPLRKPSCLFGGSQKPASPTVSTGLDLER